MSQAAPTTTPLVRPTPKRLTQGALRARQARTIGERVIRAILVIFLVTLGSVWLLNLAPGSAADIILGENATPAAVKALNKKLGLDQPVLTQYWHWVKNAIHGDLGTSPLNGLKVTTSIFNRLPVTLEIAGLALLISLIIAMPLAIAAASHQGGLLDRTANAISSVFLSIPAFVAGPLLIYFFSVKLQWFPVSGWVYFRDDPWGNLKSAFLPALAVAFTESAVFTRVLRADLVGTLREDYVAAARAKGMSRSYVMLRHALRPSAFSLVTVAGLSLGRLIGGTVVVEALFGLPGLGQLIQTAIVQRDIITVQGVVVFVAVVFVVVNTLIDVSYGLLDPRVRKAGRS